MILVADSNELGTNPSIIERMKKTFPKMLVSSLSFGDYNAILEDGTIVAIERKNVGDFLNSIADGRVFRQVEQMSAATFYCIIMVGQLRFNKEDMTIADNRLTGWKGKAVRAAIMAIQFSGCPVVGCEDDYDFPEVVSEVIQFSAQPLEHHQKIGHRRIVTFPPLELPIEILAAFPGVGVKRAQALMDYVSKTNYNSLGGALAWASAFPLIKEGGRPEGWGNKTVANFRGLLGLRDGQYLEIKEEGNASKKATPKKK
jgi:ERCC4-type nuclease